MKKLKVFLEFYYFSNDELDHIFLIGSFPFEKKSSPEKEFCRIYTRVSVAITSCDHLFPG